MAGDLSVVLVVDPNACILSSFVTVDDWTLF